MVDMKAMLEQLGFESTEDKRKKEIQERDRRNGAIDKDIVFGKAYKNNKDEVYHITATIDAISRNKKGDRNVRIVSVNTIHITINGKEYIANHTHIRGDRVRQAQVDYRLAVGQTIELDVKVRPYRDNNRKFELVDVNYR